MLHQPLVRASRRFVNQPDQPCFNSMIVLGANAVGLELAQTFARAGTATTGVAPLPIVPGPVEVPTISSFYIARDAADPQACWERLLPPGTPPERMVGEVYAGLATADFSGTVRLWDGESGAAIETFSGHARVAERVTFSADGRLLVSAGADGTVRIYDVVEGAQVAVLAGHDDQVLGLALSADGSRLARREAMAWSGCGTRPAC